MRLKNWIKAAILSVFAIGASLPLFVADFRVNITAHYSPTQLADYKFILPDSVPSDTLLFEVTKTVQRILRTECLRGGASVAISQHGRLVYAKGIGFSSLTDSSSMTPNNILRVASVSKLITAVAVMRLVDSGKLVLDQRVFGPTGILCDDYYRFMRDSRMLDVTVRQLLNHSGGWTSHYGDPMFMHSRIATEMGLDLPISMKDIIRFMQTKHMHFTPGTASVYSNFGYGILGEVIEKASGMPYEDFVRATVFAPLGITDARLGYSHFEDRLPDEVTYYEQDTSSLVPDYAVKGDLSRRAYGGSDIHTLGSAGGWVVSAVDLVKLMLTIDGFESVPDQISPKLVGEMTNPNSHLDPLGWRKVIGDVWFRTGTLQATSAVMCRRPDGICFAIVFNSSNSLGPNLAVSVANKMNAAINHVFQWPDTDLLANDVCWQAYIRKNAVRH